MIKSETLLHNFFSELARIDASFIERLSPPASEEDIRRLEDHLEVQLDSDVRQLYGLHDGERDDFSAGTIFGNKFLSINQVIEQHQTLVELRQSGIFEDENPVDRRLTQEYAAIGHIPIFSDDCGNYVGFDMAPSATGNFGQIVIFGADLTHTKVVFRSLSAMIETLLHQLQRKNYVLREDAKYFRYPWLEFKAKKFSPITKVFWSSSVWTEKPN